MATIILAGVIFGFAGYVVYKKIKSPGDCGDCNCDCGIKPKSQN